MTPELPRAPLSAPRAAAAATTETSALSTAESSLTALIMVRDMLVPVSPSGTGKTFSASTAALLCSSIAAPSMIISLRRRPSMFVRKANIFPPDAENPAGLPPFFSS